MNQPIKILLSCVITGQHLQLVGSYQAACLCGKKPSVNHKTNIMYFNYKVLLHLAGDRLKKMGNWVDKQTDFLF